LGARSQQPKITWIATLAEGIARQSLLAVVAAMLALQVRNTG
jgi:hypothetical protein